MTRTPAAVPPFPERMEGEPSVNQASTGVQSTDHALLALAERVEAAAEIMAGALIEDAWELIAPTFPRDGLAERAGNFSLKLDARAYLSAAMMLVPDKAALSCSFYGNTNAVRLTAPGGEGIGVASSPALALTSAALRAHAARLSITREPQEG